MSIFPPPKAADSINFSSSAERASLKKQTFFALECDNELLALQQVSAELSAAQATLQDFHKGSRPEEIDVIEAQLSQAKAASENAAIQLSQNKALFLVNAAPKTQFEDSTALAKSTAARVQELQHALNVSRLPERTDQISAQEDRIAQLHSARGILLSGFMFPFSGMPTWAQHVREILPLTYFNRLIRGIVLKDNDFMAL